jgi:TRAP-type transport system small permease protein
LLRAYRILIVALTWGTGLLLIAVTVLVLLAAGVRYLGISPGSLHWVTEVTRFGVIWLVMLGAAVAHDQGAHVAIEISSRIPGKIRRPMETAGAVVTIAFLAVLFAYGLELSVRTMHQVTPALQMPVGFAYLALPVGALLMLIQSIVFVIRPGLRAHQDTLTRTALSGGR